MVMGQDPTRWRAKSLYEERAHRESGDAGAVLVLALVFMVASGTLILGLLSWSGNGLRDVAAFQQSRTVNYAANSAMSTAIQNVRYSTTACPSTGLSIPVNGITMQIWCSPSNPQPEGGTAASRVITFSACTSTAISAGTCSQTTPYLEVVVTYDDYQSVTQIGSSVPCSTTCGATVTINSWVFKGKAI
jgi:hypothetical protein